ncbi:MAG: hypothetical protein L0Y68_01685 [Candidatus Dadabacteria bacterium]|nr:hypothetical protein [Candidatus Dadabacteria bacterium]
MSYKSIKAFNEISWSSFFKEYSDRIREEIESKGKKYILGVDEEEYKNYLFEKYLLEPLEIDIKNEQTDEPTKSTEWVESRIPGNKFQREFYIFTVRYLFKGFPILFRVQPDTWQVTSYDIYVDEENSTVSFNFKLYNKDPEEFKRKKSNCFTDAFINIENINKNAKSWNDSLRHLVSSLFNSLKAKYLDENKFFEAINIKANKDADSIFTAPTIKKKIIPQPAVSSKKELSSVPTMSKEMYDDVLRVIYNAGKSMEKKPALYQDKDEEGLRDQFLFMLETRYEGTTATGETFNRSGKTDILLKYAKDGSNLFVAECKFWHGASEFREAINQLFDKYLTWRDSKVALILFVKNKEFTKVIETIKSETVKHPYFTTEMGTRGETSFSYIFHLPQDKEKDVYFEIIAFHYDK